MSVKKLSGLVGLLMLPIALLAGQVPLQQKTLHFGCGVSEGHIIFQTINQAMTAVLEPLGYQFHMETYPRVRGVAELESGRLDGFCGKAEHFFKGSHNALPVLPPVAMSQMMLFGRVDSPNFEEVQGTSEVLYVRGSNEIEKYLKGTQFKATPVITIAQGLKMVAAGRADYLIEFDIPGFHVLNALKLQQQLKAIPTGYYSPIFMPLHRRHKHLLKDIGEGLNQYARDTYGRETLFSVINQKSTSVIIDDSTPPTNPTKP